MAAPPNGLQLFRLYITCLLYTSYIAVIAAMEKPIGSISSKLWQCVLLLVMLGSAIYICTTCLLYTSRCV